MVLPSRVIERHSVSLVLHCSYVLGWWLWTCGLSEVPGPFVEPSRFGWIWDRKRMESEQQVGQA